MGRDSSVVGAVGILIVATRGRGGAGEVLVKIRGGSESYLAWSDEPLPRGTTVLVVESRGARTVAVVALSAESTPTTGVFD
jgi:membrane protein implicated in regulation of membrane protease activity